MRRLAIILTLAASGSTALAAEERDAPIADRDITALKAAIRANPLNLRAYYYLGAQYLGFGSAPSDEELAGINTDLATSGEFFDDAQQRWEAGEVRAAAIQLRNAIEADPDNVSAYLLLAEIYRAENAPRLAEQALRDAQEHGADPSVTLEPLAEALLESGQYERVLADLPFTGLEPRLRSRVMVMHARAQIGLQEWDLAKQMLENALRVYPEQHMARLEFARLAIFEVDLASAQQWLDKIGEAGDYLPDYWLLSGEIARLQGEFENALADYARAIRLDEDHLLALNSAAELNWQLGDIAEAKRLIERILERHRGDLRGLLLALTIATEEGDRIEREELLATAKAVIDQVDYSALQKDPYGLFLVGNLHYLAGRMDEANLTLSAYNDRVPGDIRAVARISDAQLRLGRPDSAQKTIEDAAQYLEENPAYWLLAADAFAANRDYTRALNYYERFVADNPDRVDVRLRYARVLANLGRYDDALAELRALQQISELPEITRTMASILLALGEYETLIEITSDLPPGERDLVQGKAQLGKGDLAAAEALFRQVLASEPQNDDAEYNLGLIAKQRREFAAAGSHFKTIADRNAQHRSSRLQLAELAERRNATQVAIRNLEQAMAIREDLPNQLRLVRLLVEEHQEQAAREILTSLRLQYQDDLRVLVAQAELNLETGNTDRAYQLFNTMRDIALEASSVETLAYIAGLQFEAGDRQGASRTIQNALAIDPSSLALAASRAEIYYQEGRYEEAAELAQTLITAAPAAAAGYRMLAAAERRLGDPQQAEATLRTGIERTDGDRTLVLSLFDLLREARSPTAALEYLIAYVEEETTVHYTVLRTLAGALADAGNYHRAIEINRALIESRPADPVTLNNLALAYFAIGDPQARTIAEQAYELAPDNAAVMDTLGWILVNDGELPLATTLLRNAVARSADVPEIRYHYAVALVENGNRRQAMEELRELLASGAAFSGREDARQLYDSLL